MEEIFIKTERVDFEEEDSLLNAEEPLNDCLEEDLQNELNELSTSVGEIDCYKNAVKCEKTDLYEPSVVLIENFEHEDKYIEDKSIGITSPRSRKVKGYLSKHCKRKLKIPEDVENIQNSESLTDPENSNWSEDSESRLKSDTCSFEVDDENGEFYQETSTKAKDEGKFYCPECDYNTLVEKLLKLHRQIHARDVLYSCTECDYTTYVRRNLTIHRRGHSKVKKYKCTDCSYATNVKGCLMQHMLTHNVIKPYKCDECSYESNRKEHLEEHKMLHLNIKQFECGECPYKTNIKRNLIKHVQRHSENFVYKCSEVDCDYETNVKIKLCDHMVKHSTDKLFKCSECNFETKRKRSLVIHMDVHAQFKKFRCQLCSYEAHRKTSMKDHNVAKHPELSYYLNKNISCIKQE